MPLTHDETYRKEFDGSEEAVEVQEARQALKADEKRRMFPYGYVRDKYGMLYGWYSSWNCKWKGAFVLI